MRWSFVGEQIVVLAHEGAVASAQRLRQQFGERDDRCEPSDVARRDLRKDRLRDGEEYRMSLNVVDERRCIEAKQRDIGERTPSGIHGAAHPTRRAGR